MLTNDDMALLRRFEPVLRFNRGEQFYPMDAERYVANCQLCVKRPNDAAEVLVPRGQLTVEQLTLPRHDQHGSVYYLHFVDPLPPLQVAEFRRNSTLREFTPGRGRLARVGILARLGDLVFSVSLLLRGKTPGGSAAAAALRYQQLMAQDERYCYYGRVVRQHGYIVLQYWFFYAFNDWRSSFFGVNDHEGDWEPVSVYLAEDPAGAIQPCWLAYSSHEFQGDDMRRRWDDPNLMRVGEHPVVFVAAGAHANYFMAGEYLPSAEVPYSRELLRVWGRVRYFWQQILRQVGSDLVLPDVSAIRIPFVDYARGDGMSIGPGQARTWEVRPLQATQDTPAPTWVDGFSGLWGLYTGDPLEGEDAPARPKYNRNGTVFNLWYDPVGWCGLDKVPPPARALAALAAQRQRLHDEQARLDGEIDSLVQQLVGLEIEAEAVQTVAHLRLRFVEVERQARVAALELDRLKARRAANSQTLEQFAYTERQLAAGDYGPPDAHLRLPQLPASTDDLRLSRWAEAWSALSIGVLLIGAVVVALLSRQWGYWLVGLIGVFAFIESLFQRQVRSFIHSVCVGLAVVTLLVLLYTFFWPIVLTLLLLAGLVVVVENARELRF